MTTFVVPVIDYGGEISQASFPVDPAVLDADLTGLFNALDGITIGNLGTSKLHTSTQKDVGPGGASAVASSTRNLKWLARYHDAVTLEKLTLEIPSPKTALLSSGTDFANLSAGDGLTFKTDFNALVKSRITGNAVVLDTMELRGRKYSRKKPK